MCDYEKYQQGHRFCLHFTVIFPDIFLINSMHTLQSDGCGDSSIEKSSRVMFTFWPGTASYQIIINGQKEETAAICIAINKPH